MDPVVGLFAEALDAVPDLGPAREDPAQAAVDQLVVERDQGRAHDDGEDALDAGQHQAGDPDQDQQPADQEDGDADAERQRRPVLG